MATKIIIRAQATAPAITPINKGKLSLDCQFSSSENSSVDSLYTAWIRFFEETGAIRNATASPRQLFSRRRASRDIVSLEAEERFILDHSKASELNF